MHAVRRWRISGREWRDGVQDLHGRRHVLPPWRCDRALVPGGKLFERARPCAPRQLHRMPSRLRVRGRFDHSDAVCAWHHDGDRAPVGVHPMRRRRVSERERRDSMHAMHPRLLLCRGFRCPAALPGRDPQGPEPRSDEQRRRVHYMSGGDCMFSWLRRASAVLARFDRTRHPSADLHVVRCGHFPTRLRPDRV